MHGNMSLRNSGNSSKAGGANLGKADRNLKESILAQIKRVDHSSSLDDEGWAHRYHLEDQLTHLAKVEEEYWRQQSRQNWILKGDANTAYLHAIANGR
jgi:hypothetical protein